MNAVARGHLDGFQVEGAGFVLAGEYYLAKGLDLSCNFLKNSSSLFFSSSLHPSGVVSMGRNRQICSVTALSSDSSRWSR